MRKKYVVVALMILAAAIVGIGCGGDGPFNPEETIIFENRTGLNGMNCFIDGVLKGTVNNGQDLRVEGDYAGDRVLHVNVGGRTATRSERIENGMTFIYTIY